MNVLIVGGGHVGFNLASLLLKDGHQVRIVEMRSKQLKALQHDLPGDRIVSGDFTDPVVLEEAGIQQADVVVALTPTDEGNLVIASLARFEFGVNRVIARANNPKNTWMFTPEMGVDVVLSEADLMARIVAEDVLLGDMVTLLKLKRGQFSLVTETILPGSPVIGKALKELGFPEECVLVSVIRGDDVMIPSGSTVLNENDEILVLAAVSQLQPLAMFLKPKG
jgi:trk system potassium uptake protein